MSRRTAEAHKAIEAAWQNEQQLVREGKGTRDWTPEQQQDILNIGKAYDDDGKAFEGHHMKSVEKYPDYQGNPENIQFLTRSEHCEAHNGKFQNPTNGYFNPATGETQDFGEKSPKPCKSIELSNPVVCKKATNGNLKEPSEPSIERSDVHPDTSISHQAAQLTEDTGSGGLIQFGRKVVKGFAGFATEHPILTGLAVAAAAGGIEIIKSTVFTNNGGGGAGTGSDEISFGESLPIQHDEEDNSFLDKDEETVTPEESSIESSESVERASPREHSVTGYDRQQNGKTVHVKPYKRGKSKDS